MKNKGLISVWKLKKAMRGICICAALLPATFKAQTFNYTLSVDSSAAYQELTSNVPVCGDTTNWNFFYKKAIGFSFPFLGRNFDSLRIETNGYVVFGGDNNYALMAFHNFKCKIDSLSHYSSISSELSGSPGSKILKLEFKNLGQGNDPQELLSYQIWLRENGNVEVMIGPNSYPPVINDSILDTSQAVMIGLINRNKDTGTRGLFISNTPSNPQSLPIDDEHTDIPYLKTMPRSGYRYVFTPGSN